MSSLDLIRFEPNTIAKSSEVNHNFDLLTGIVQDILARLSDAENSIEQLEENKADLNGNPLEAFDVGNAIADTNAINMATLNNRFGNLIYYIYGLVITADHSDSSKIIVSSGSCYDSTGSVTISLQESVSAPEISLQASEDYNVFIVADGGNTVEIDITEDPVESYTPSLEYYRYLGSFSTKSNGDIDPDTIVNQSNTQGSTSLSFISNQISSGDLPVHPNDSSAKSLSDYLPNNNKTYLVWTYISFSGTGSSAYRSVQSDLMPSAITLARLDSDAGRSTKAAGNAWIPVGSDRKLIIKGGAVTILGYMGL